jgi:hypothetical protein
MTRVAILPEVTADGKKRFRAVAGEVQTVGATVGQALDAISSQISDSGPGTLFVVQSFEPDQYFNADQQRRLGELMALWRRAQESGQALPVSEQSELDALIQAEFRGAEARSRAMLAARGR